MEQDPPRRGPKIKITKSCRLPPETLERAIQFIKAGVRKSEAIEINERRKAMNLPPLFEVKP